MALVGLTIHFHVVKNQKLEKVFDLTCGVLQFKALRNHSRNSNKG